MDQLTEEQREFIFRTYRERLSERGIDPDTHLRELSFALASVGRKTLETPVLEDELGKVVGEGMSVRLKNVLNQYSENATLYDALRLLRDKNPPVRNFGEKSRDALTKYLVAKGIFEEEIEGTEVLDHHEFTGENGCRTFNCVEAFSGPFPPTLTSAIDLYRDPKNVKRVRKVGSI